MRALRIQNRCHWFSRRAFIGGAGALVALPAFEALTAKFARGQAVGAPQRFIAWYFPCGVPSIGDWPNLLGGLDAVKTKMTIVSGLRNAGRGPDHTYGTRAFLTGDFEGMSFDQALADGLAGKPGKAPIHSLQLGAPDMVCEPNGPCEFLNNVSYGEGGNVVTKQQDAQAAFDNLFMGFDGEVSGEEAAARRVLRTSVLDLVQEDAENLKTLLSATDKAKLDEYLSSVRDAEERIANAVGGMACASVQGALDNIGEGYEASIDAHTEVMALALECDLTRVITFMSAAGATGKNNLGTNQDYHLDITHRADGGWEQKFKDVVTWEMEKFGALMARLDSKTDVDGNTILDNTAAFCSSEISDGNGHNHDDMPVLLVGGLGGKLNPGVTAQIDASFVDLFAYIGEQMGTPVQGFGDASLITGV